MWWVGVIKIIDIYFCFAVCFWFCCAWGNGASCCIYFCTEDLSRSRSPSKQLLLLDFSWSSHTLCSRCRCQLNSWRWCLRLLWWLIIFFGWGRSIFVWGGGLCFPLIFRRWWGRESWKEGRRVLFFLEDLTWHRTFNKIIDTITQPTNYQLFNNKNKISLILAVQGGLYNLRFKL